MKKLSVGLGVLTFLAMSLNAVTYYVSPTGSDSNSGTNVASPFLTLAKAVSSSVAGDTIYMRGGTHSYTSKVSINKNGSAGNYIKIWAYPGETPVIDFTGIGGSTDGLSISGTYWHLKGLEVKKATHNGINISGHYNIIENCAIHDNGNTGLHMGSSSGTSYPSNNLVLNCDSYFNFDSPIGGNADGFSAKWNVGAGNVFRGCRSYNNSDDGWDLWMGKGSVTINSCLAYSNGVDIWHTGQVDGNGNGFKLGGSYVATPHLVKNCVAFDNYNGRNNGGKGFDENNNIAGQTLYNCTSYRNAYGNFVFTNDLVQGQSHVIKNCISYDGEVNISSATQQSNSWQGFTVTNADFVSLDVSLASSPRNADGSLPVTDLFRLSPTSSMIDAGVDVGLPYNGAAPDLGAYETTPPPWFETSPTSLSWTNNGFGLRLNGLTGHGEVVLYASTTLTNWLPIYTNPPATGSVQFVDLTVTNLPWRFYRAEER